MPLLIPFLQRFRNMKDNNEDEEDDNEENEEDLNHKDVDDMEFITEKYVLKRAKRLRSISKIIRKLFFFHSYSKLPSGFNPLTPYIC